MEQDLDLPWVDSPARSLRDWPEFFQPIWAYPLKIVGEFLQLALLAIAVGQGNTVLHIMGANILGTFIVHLYIGTQIKDVIHSAWFQEVGSGNAFIGGSAQLAVIFAYPICFGLTVGPAVMWLMIQATKLPKLVA